MMLRVTISIESGIKATVTRAIASPTTTEGAASQTNFMTRGMFLRAWSRSPHRGLEYPLQVLRRWLTAFRITLWCSRVGLHSCKGCTILVITGGYFSAAIMHEGTLPAN